MKRSGMEVKLLIVLLVVLLGYAFYNFGLKPLMQRVEELQVNVAAEAAAVQQTYADTWEYSEYVTEIRRTSKKIVDISTKYYTSEEQEVLLDQVDRCLQKSGMTYVRITSAEPIQFDYSDEINGTAGGSGSEDSGAMEDRMPALCTAIIVEATGKYSNVKSFLTELMRSDKYTVATEMTVEVTPQSQQEKSEDPDVRMKIALAFVNLKQPNLANAESAEGLYDIPDRPNGFVLPADLGEYGRPFSMDQLPGMFQALTSRFTNN